MFEYKKVTAIILAAALGMGTNVVNTYATATPSEVKESLPNVTEVSNNFDLILGNANTKESSTPDIIIDLPNAGDSQTINMQIDHSIYPNAVLFGYIQGDNLGTCTVKIADEMGTNVSSFTIFTTPASSGSTPYPKQYTNIISKEGQLKNYTITVSTTTGDASCALNLGTISDFAEKYGGRNNIATVAKNQSTGYGVSRIMGQKTLLNGDGEWFRYKADGDTFIGASVDMQQNMECIVYDAETWEVFDRATAKNFEKEVQSSTIFTGHVQKLFHLQPGHEYFIQVKSTSNVTAKVGDLYGITIGLPYTLMKTVDITSASSYSIPANVSKTFLIDVNWSKADRLSQNSYVQFSTPKSVDNVYITSCDIVAPNGKIIRTTYGEGKYEGPVDFSDFLNSSSNIPINGTWKATIKSSKSLSNLQLKLTVNVYHVAGKYEN